MTKYWVHVLHTGEYDSKDGVVGLGDQWKDSISKVSKGDRIVTYLPDRSAFVDLKEVTKGYYIDNKNSKNDHTGRHRICVKSVYSCIEPVEIRGLSSLNFIKDKDKLSENLNKPLMRISNKDFNKIQKSIVERYKMEEDDFLSHKKRLESELKKRVSTGVKGLDELIEGGFPYNSTILVTGGPGTGKTIFCIQFLRHGALRGEPGIYISMDERPDDLRREALKFNWDLKKLEKEKKLALVDVSYPRSGIPSKEKYKLGMPFTLDSIVTKVVDIISDIGAKRVVLDSLPAFGIHFQDEAEIRIAIHRLNNLLLGAGCTSIITSEIVSGAKSMSRFGVEEFISRGTILMELITSENTQKEFTRRLTIMKMRETEFNLRKYMFRIGKDGINVLPTEVRF